MIIDHYIPKLFDSHLLSFMPYFEQDSVHSSDMTINKLNLLSFSLYWPFPTPAPFFSD